MEIINIVDEIRVEKGWSWSRLSRESSTSANSLSNWRHGRTSPTISNIEKVLGALGYGLEVVLEQ